MPPLEPAVLESVDQALKATTRELNELRDAGRSLGAASGSLQDASAALLLSTESLVGLAERVKALAEAISRLDPSSIDARMSALLAALDSFRGEHSRTVEEGNQSAKERAAEVALALANLQSALDQHIEDTQAAVAATGASHERLAESLRGLAGQTEAGLGACMQQVAAVGQQTRGAVDDVRAGLESTTRAEAKRIADELVEVRDALERESARSRVLLYVVLAISILALATSATGLLLPR